MTPQNIDKNYIQWLSEIKEEIRKSQIKASVAVNRQLIMLYWDLGRQITIMQEKAKWGDGFLAQLSKDLIAEFPQMKGLAIRNLQLCKRFYLFYNQMAVKTKQLVSFLPDYTEALAKQPVSQLQYPNVSKSQQQAASLLDIPIFNIPWGHNILIMQRCKDINTALFYVGKTIENNWSRSVLEYQIENHLIDNIGKAQNNFCLTLPAPQGDLANAILKDHYTFDFLQLTEKAQERDIESALVTHITDFLLSLGQGFAYMGRQFPLKVGDKEYRTDLLFYHTRLRCYIVIELKATEFEPEFIGKLSFYVSAINRLIKHEQDNPTIGVLLCKSKNDFEVEIALQDINKPIGVSTYSYHTLPIEIKPELKALEKLQEELNKKQFGQ